MYTYKYALRFLLLVLSLALVTEIEESKSIAHEAPYPAASGQVQFPFTDTILSGYEFDETWPCWTDTDADGEVDTISGYVVHTGGDWVGANGDTNVRAIADGVVTFVHHDTNGFGNHLEIAHRLPDGTEYHSQYAHLQANSITVSQDNMVTRGTIIGLMGQSGGAFGPHLHFDIRIQDVGADDWPSPCQGTSQQAHDAFDGWLASGDVPRYVDPWNFLINMDLANQIVFYEDTYFRGQSFTWQVVQAPPFSFPLDIPVNLEHQVSSYSMPNDWYAVGYKNNDVVYPNFTMSDSDLDLRNNSFTDGTSGNDSIAAVFVSTDQSIVQSCIAQQGGGISCLPNPNATPLPGSTPTPVPTPTPSCQTSDTGVTLFEHEGQGTTGGKCHTYGEGSYGNLGNQGLGGNASSLRNPNNGFMVRLYDQANFGGTTAVFDTSVNNLGVYGWGDKAQSMVVERHISTACSPNPNAPVLYVDVNYGSGCVSVTQDIPDLSVYGMQNALDSVKFLGTSVGSKEVFLYHDKNYQNLCGSYWQDQSDLRSCAGVSESVRVQAFTAPTPIPTVVGDVYTGNIADEAYIDKSTTASMVDGSLTTTWYAGAKVNVGFSWPVPVDVHHIKVWDTGGDTPTNGHINSLAIHFSDGTLISHVDMISAGPRCADITFPVRNNITWVNVVLIDSSGNMGYREVEIYATTGTQYTNNTCANPRSLTPTSGSVIPPSSVAPVATAVPTATATPMPTATPALPQSGTYPVGANPQNVYVAFSSLWVANYNNNTITRLSLATGGVQATISTGSFPFDITSDGSYIYVTLYGSNAIAKIDPLSNTVVGSLPFPDSHPWLIEYDGTSLWITSFWNHARVVKMNPSSGSVLCSTSGTGVVNLGLRVDGSYIWTSDTYNNTLYKINTSNCSVALGPLAVGSSPREITSDSTHVWVANYSSVSVSKIDKSSGSVVASYPAGSNPYAAAVLNGIVYITNWQAGSGTSVTARASSNGSLVNTYTVGTGPVGIVSDGVSLFVANSGSNTVSRIVP